jgi:hypothetical protein
MEEEDIELTVVKMAEACRDGTLLTGPPTIELYDGVSAHDLA